MQDLKKKNINFLPIHFLDFSVLISEIQVVIGQCNRTVGCNRTPVIGQLHEPNVLGPLH